MTDLPYSKRILELADKWIKGAITEEEKKEFADWYGRFDDHELLLAPEFEPLIGEMESAMLITIRQRLSDDGVAPSHRPKGLFRRMAAWQIAAAAVVAAGALLLPFLKGTNSRQQESVTLQQPVAPAHTDTMPGINKAILTLDDGAVIVLDRAHNGSLTRQGNTEVVKSPDGTLQYKAVAGDEQNNRTAPVAYNLLATPRGGQYKLTLPDGTRVWLNAASSIRYPTAFRGTSREVEVTGEAYFEIAKNADMPFRVLSVNHLGDTHPMAIEVLGTSFNVNAYDEESMARTTLIEGRVSVSKGLNKTLLEAGQQAEMQQNGTIRRITDADVGKAIAWKEGIFSFGDEELPVIMREIARWYDVEIVYEGPIPKDRFTGRVSRNTSLSGLLKILKLSDVQLTVVNNKIIVRS